MQEGLVVDVKELPVETKHRSCLYKLLAAAKVAKDVPPKSEEVWKIYYNQHHFDCLKDEANYDICWDVIVVDSCVLC